MRTRRFAHVLVVALIVAATVLSACGAAPTATPVVIEKQVPVTQVVVQTQVVPVVQTQIVVQTQVVQVPQTQIVEKVVTATPVPPAATKPPAPTPTPLPNAKCDRLPDALSPKPGDLGSPNNPIVIAFVPSTDVSVITRGGTLLADCLTSMTGLTFKIQVGTSEAASIEAMGGGKAQMGFLNTFSILLAKQKYDVDVKLIALRKYGYQSPPGTYKAFDFDPDKALAGQMAPFYKPEYFTRADTGIKTLADVKGHSFCFTTAGSTSGGIIPRAVFKAMGIDPDKDIKSTYAGGHDKAAIGVYQGDCDAGVAFMDILTDPPTNLAAKFPDIAQKVQVFAVGDRIPNDGFQVIKSLDPKITDISVNALMTMMQDPGGAAIVYSIYAYNAFEKTDFNTYYAPFQETLKQAGVDVATLVRQ
jgi:phosphonate transport system substrate-binding protein